MNYKIGHCIVWLAKLCYSMEEVIIFKETIYFSDLGYILKRK